MNYFIYYTIRGGRSVPCLARRADSGSRLGTEPGSRNFLIGFRIIRRKV